MAKSRKLDQLRGLHWILDLAYADLDRLDKKQQTDLFVGVVVLFLTINGKGGFSSIEEKEDHNVNFKALQDELRKGLDLLRDGNEWDVPMTSARGITLFSKKEKLYRRMKMSQHDAFLDRAQNLLLEHWDALRFCENPECRKAFIPASGRQRFCSRYCSQKTRTARYLEGKPGKKTSKKKTRKKS